MTTTNEQADAIGTKFVDEVGAAITRLCRTHDANAAVSIALTTIIAWVSILSQLPAEDAAKRVTQLRAQLEALQRLLDEIGGVALVAAQRLHRALGEISTTPPPSEEISPAPGSGTMH